jgi:pyruvate formate lyase activating enzyme
MPNFKVNVNGQEVESSGMVKDAIKKSGVNISKYLCDDTGESGGASSKQDCLFVPCECGGCWACVVEVNGRMALACNTPLDNDMQINTFKEFKTHLRVMSGFGVHRVGGVGTPYYLKKNLEPIEVIGFTHGCNLRCLQCQNDVVAFTSRGNLIEPEEAAQILLGLQDLHGLDTIAFSGGESTLNRPWILKALKLIRESDKSVNIHIDTNGTVLTPRYIDELINSGMNRIGIDLKGINIKTFQNITGITDKPLAAKYLENSWNAVKYIADNYKMDYGPEDKIFKDFDKDKNNKNHNGVEKPKKDISSTPKIFLGIGIPYNSSLISKKEIRKMGNIIKNINPYLQVCVLDYRPEFKRMDLKKPDFHEMKQIKDILNETGLKTVIIQTEKGHFGP